MSGKNYGDIRQLAMGDVSHDELAHRLLQVNASTPDLSSLTRAAHDRIMHLAETGGTTDTSEIETLRQQLHEANLRLNEAAGNAVELNGKLIESEQKWLAEKDRADGLQEKVNVLSADLQRIADNYDLSDLDAEGDGEEEKIEDRENEADFSAEERPGYMPSRDEIKEIAIRHGYRTRKQANGKEDLNDYVYLTVEESVTLAHSKS